MAEGRTNRAIAGELSVAERAVEHARDGVSASSICPPARDDHRRVLAVLTFLDSA